MSLSDLRFQCIAPLTSDNIAIYLTSITQNCSIALLNDPFVHKQVGSKDCDLYTCNDIVSLTYFKPQRFFVFSGRQIKAWNILSNQQMGVENGNLLYFPTVGKHS